MVQHAAFFQLSLDLPGKVSGLLNVDFLRIFCGVFGVGIPAVKEGMAFAKLHEISRNAYFWRPGNDIDNILDADRTLDADRSVPVRWTLFQVNVESDQLPVGNIFPIHTRAQPAAA